MKKAHLILFSILLLFSCSENSNKPDSGTPGPTEPTIEELTAICSQDPSLLTDEIIAKCKEFEQAQKDQLSFENVKKLCEEDPQSLPSEVASKCKAILHPEELTVAEMTELCEGDLTLLPEELKQKCSQINNTIPPEYNFEKNGASRWSLTNLELKSFDIEKSVSEEAMEMTNQVIQDFKDCGLSLNGSLCLDRVVERRQELGEYLDASNQLVYVVEIKYAGIDTPLVFEFVQSEVKNDQYKPELVKVYAKLFGLTYGVDLDSYLQSQAVVKMMTGSIIAVSEGKNFGLQLDGFKNIRSLYHHLVGVAATVNFSGVFNNNFSILVREITKKKELIVKSGNEVYQFATLVLLRDGLKIGDYLFLEMCRDLKNAKNDFLKQYVSVYIANYDYNQDQLRPIVVEALGHQYAKLRIEALKYLFRKQLSTSEENAVLLLLDDEDKEVRDAAGIWANSFRADKDNFPSLKLLSESKLKDVRKTSLNLMDPVKTDEVTKLMIRMLNDDEDDVRTLAIRYSKSRTIKKDMILLLEEPLNSPHYYTRKAAVDMLEKTKDSSALVLLNARLLIETNFLLKYEIENAIKNMTK